MSGVINKVKEAVSGNHSSTTNQGAPEGTHGPHNNRVANAADPRVDSDRDHRAAPGSTIGGSQPYASGDNYTHGTLGTTGTTGYTGATGQTTSGPHQSNIANKADPRIDSDQSGRYAGNAAGDYGGSGPEGVAGPHNSRLANAADPRVDSDRDGSRTVGNTYGSSGTAGTTGSGYAPSSTTAGTGYGTAGTGATGTHGTHGTHGAHGAHGTTGTHGTTGSHGTTGTHGTTGIHDTHGATGAAGAAGAAGATGAGYGTGTTGTHSQGVTGTHAAHSGPGPAPNTAGPHKSDVVNKLDPRVDSDLDGSKTVGGNKTYQSGNSAAKDPTDAAQVPPSVLREHVGEPIVEHGGHKHGHKGL
ncbi:hypothetical protein F5B19DRAFT_493842 [Rostrohypoxylon terebratum]|nr:hypothetical protein F5B19DRAFT_493842 [Rostrohypoxylon terebratum]